jgi:hypothetical protein
VGDLIPGREVLLEVTLKPGRYIIVCHVPSAANERPHYLRGMLAEFTIS